MAHPDVDTGFGATVAFTVLTALNGLKLTDINWNPGDRPMIETTDYGTGAPGALDMGNATFIGADVMDGGTFEFEYHFNPDVVLPTTAVADAVTITWAGGLGNATWTFSGIVVPSSGAMPMKDRMVCTITVKVSGAIAVLADAAT